MKRLPFLTWAFLLFGAVVVSTASAYNSLYVFGDGICTTTNNPAGPDYYGNRFCNGRVWIEVLAQRQGLTYDANKNWSYFGQYSTELTNNVSHFAPPADATNALFVMWANDADFIRFLGQFNPPYTAADIPAWTSAMNVSLTNHFIAITNLYTKGVRSLVIPNAVDVTAVPQYNNMGAANRSFVLQRIIAYNSSFTNIVNQAKVLCPGLKIFVPDVFKLLNNVLTNAGAYGLTNALQGSVSSGALDYYYNLGFAAATNGLGTNFIFWDYLNPTAKMQEVLADTVQQVISPTRISQVLPVSNGLRVDVINLPVGLNGFVNGRTNLAQTNWTNVQSITSTNVNQTIIIPTGPHQFYQLRFPYAWSWP